MSDPVKTPSPPPAGKVSEVAVGTPPTPTPVLANSEAYQTALATAILSGIFCLITSGILISNYYQGAEVAALLEDQELNSLKKELQKEPKNEELKVKIRRRDYELRNNLFKGLEFDKWGTYLLVFSSVVLLGSLQYVVSCKPIFPNPLLWGARSAPKEVRQVTVYRLVVLGTGLLLASFVVFLGLGTPGLAFLSPIQDAPEPGPGVNAISAVDPTTTKTDDSTMEAPPGAKTEAPDSYPTMDEAANHWAQFRGPNGSGIYKDAAPTDWDATTNKNILWRTKLPLGVSSPVLWGNRIFVTSATAKKRFFYSLDADTGKLLWETEAGEVDRVSNEEPAVYEEKEGFGSCTPVTDGKRVYAIFANGDIVAVDYDGKIKWKENLGLPNNHYGHSSSLLQWKNLILVQFDFDSEDAVSDPALYALDAATGDIVWETPREYGASWSSPILIKTKDRLELITITSPMLIANDPKTGKELWKAEVMDGEVAPAPIYAGGLIFAAMLDSGMAAVRPGGSGDVTKTHVAWLAEGNLPDTSSPVSDGTYIWTEDSDGYLTCFNAKDGKEVWNKETEISGYSSPAIAGQNVYFTSEKGETLIIKIGDTFQESGHGKLGEKVSASLVFSKDRIYIRSEKHLFCISNKKP